MEISSKNSSHANACVCFIDIYFRHRFTSNIGQCDSVNVLNGVKYVVYLRLYISLFTSHQVGLIMFQEVIGTTNDYARCHRRKVKVPIVYVSYYDITLKMTTAINNLLRCIDFSHCRTLNALLRQLFGNICHIINV